MKLGILPRRLVQVDFGSVTNRAFTHGVWCLQGEKEEEERRRNGSSDKLIDDAEPGDIVKRGNPAVKSTRRL